MFSLFEKIAKPAAVLSFLLFGYLFPVHAASLSKGTALLYGEVFFTPCAIDLDSRDQTIDMGVTPVADIKTKGYGPTRRFTIRLINCLLPSNPDSTRYDSEFYQITFEAADDAARFVTYGDAQGIELSIRDDANNIAVPSVALPARKITANAIDLNYTLQVIANGQPLKSGDYYSLIRFKMDYY